MTNPRGERSSFHKGVKFWKMLCTHLSGSFLSDPQLLLLVGIFCLTLLLSVLPDNCAKDFCLAPLLVAPDEVLKLRKGPGIFLHKTFARSERFWLMHCDWCRVLFCARMALQTWQAASLGLVSTPPKNPINSDTRSVEMLVKSRWCFLN